MSHRRRALSGLVDLAGDQAVLVGDVACPSPATRARPPARRSSRSSLSASASFSVTGKASCQSASFLTASMNSRVTSSDRLNWRSRPYSRLARMKSITSGWPTSKVRHLRAAAPAGGGDGEAHLVVDIHEGQRPGGVGAGAGDIGAPGTQRRELVADAAAGLQGQARLVHLLEDVVHGVADGARHRAVDGGGGRLVLPGAGIGGDAPGGDGAVAQRPEEVARTMLLRSLARLPPRRARARHACRCRPWSVSRTVPSLALRRYFLSQMSREASWYGMSAAEWVTTSLRWARFISGRTPYLLIGCDPREQASSAGPPSGGAKSGWGGGHNMLC